MAPRQSQGKSKAWLVAILAGILLLGAESVLLYTSNAHTQFKSDTLFRSDLVWFGLSIALVIIVACGLITILYRSTKYTLFFGMMLPVLMSAILWSQLFELRRFICLKVQLGEHTPYVITHSLKPYFFEADYWLVEDQCKTERNTEQWNAPFTYFY